MLQHAENGQEVHYPADPSKFVFDNEVSQIFPSMARRSIPNFYEAHAMHARMLEPWLMGRAAAQIADFGASRGAAVEALYAYYGAEQLRSKRVDIVMSDISASMVEYLSADFPDARVYRADLTDQSFLGDDHRASFDVVFLNYVLQFIHPSQQDQVLDKILDTIKPGGAFVYGAKEKDDSALGKLLHDQYINFRVANGYSREEIVAKTAALKNSMWPTSRLWFLSKMAAAGFSVRETTRHSVFATYFCVRDGGGNAAR